MQRDRVCRELQGHADRHRDVHGWFVGGVNRAYKTTDGGQTWTRTLSVLRSPAIIYRRVRFADPDHGWIVGNDGIIFYTDDGGDTWDEQTLPGSLGDHIQDLVVTSPTEAYLCSSDGPSGAVLRHTTDAGDTWFNEYLGPGVNDPRSGVTNGIAVVGDAVWTAGTGGDIRHLPPSCRGDLSGDGVLDLADLAAFVNAFLTQQAPADFDANGVWDLADLALFVQAFQAGCP